MKTTDAFKTTIETELQRMASADEKFAQKLQAEGKNIDDCITYILNTVKKSVCNGFTDDEIFGMAAHYYDEQTIEIGKPVNARVVVNHTVELTDDEIQEARRAAKERIISEEMVKMRKKPEAIKPEQKEAKVQVQQPTLF